MTHPLAIGLSWASLLGGGLLVQWWGRTDTGLYNRPPMGLWPQLLHTTGLWIGAGSPGAVTSFYRGPPVNAAVGGVYNSAHQAGRALDLTGCNAQDEARLLAAGFRLLRHDAGSGPHLHCEVST